jgi:hypothetical protein
LITLLGAILESSVTDKDGGRNLQRDHGGPGLRLDQEKYRHKDVRELRMHLELRLIRHGMTARICEENWQFLEGPCSEEVRSNYRIVQCLSRMTTAIHREG